MEANDRPYTGEDIIEHLFGSVRHALEQSSSSFTSSAGRCSTNLPTINRESFDSPAAYPERTIDTCGDDGLHSTTTNHHFADKVELLWAESEPGYSGVGVGLCGEDRATLQAILERTGRCESHARILESTVQTKTEETLRSLRERRRRAAVAREANVTRITSRRTAFVDAVGCKLAQARAQGLMDSRRLLLQGREATRRLQELLHECVGEFEKTRIREARRRTSSADACDAILAGKILDLRWARFCSRLEEDALGLLKAHDLGDPAWHARRSTGNGRDSSSSTMSLAAGAVTTRLKPLLARAGLSGARIVRVVGLCPSSHGEKGSGATSSAGSADHHLREFEKSRVVSGGGIMAALREDDDNSDANRSTVMAESCPLGVADAVRRAALCGNPGLKAALLAAGQPCTGINGVDDGFRRPRRRRSDSRADSDGEDRTRAVSGSIKVLGHVQSDAGQGYAVGSNGSIGSSKETRRNGATLGQDYGNEDSTALQSQGGDERSTCMVVGAEPGLLLSSSPIAWTLQPPFGQMEGVTLLTNGQRVDNRCHEDGRNSGSSRAPATHRHERVDPTASSHHISEDEQIGWMGGRTHVGHSEIGWRGGLAREVTWVSAAPVGSRIYYCLEEAEWEASQCKAFRGRSTATQNPPPTLSVNREDVEDDMGARRSSKRSAPVDVHTSKTGMSMSALSARNVQEMLITDVYRGGEGNGGKGVSKKGDAAERHARVWESAVLGDTRLRAAIGEATATRAASFIVSEISDAHRRFARSGSDRHGEERSDVRHCQSANDFFAVPNVLVARVRAGNPPAKATARGQLQKLESASLHFAPAGVLQLLGMPHCREFVEALPATARTRLLELYEGVFPDRVPPIGRLYVPLSTTHCPSTPPPRLDRETELSQSSEPCEAEPSSSQDGDERKKPLWGSRRYFTDEAVDAGGNRETAASSCGSGSGSGSGPLLGALIYPLPVHAVRELLQVHVATTRAVYAFGVEGKISCPRQLRCRRTSGLLEPSPPMSMLARGPPGSANEEDRNLGGLIGVRDAEEKSSCAVRPGLAADRAGSGGRQSEDAGLVSVRERSRLGLPATPPSAVDLLPDSSSPWNRGRYRVDFPLSLQRSRIGGDTAELAFRRPSSVTGEVTGEKPRPGGGCRGVTNRDKGAPIASSLRASLRHTYVAVLTPQIPPASVASGKALAASGTAHGDLLLAAKSLLLQVETPVRSQRRPSGKKGADGSTSAATKGLHGKEDGAGAEVEYSNVDDGRMQGVCAWRACVADAVAGSLCAVHLSVRDFLDQKSTKGDRAASEALRFLPPGREPGPKRRFSRRRRRAARDGAASSSFARSSTVHADAGKDAIFVGGDGAGKESVDGELAVIARETSPLLTELLDGKLGATIEEFFRREAAGARERRRRGYRFGGNRGGRGDTAAEGKNGRPACDAKGRPCGDATLEVPAWAKWLDPLETEAIDRKLEADMRWAEQVLRAEKEVSSELQRLSDLGIFPGSELAVIRREHGSLASEWQKAVEGHGHIQGKEGELDGLAPGSHQAPLPDGIATPTPTSTPSSTSTPSTLLPFSGGAAAGAALSEVGLSAHGARGHTSTELDAVENSGGRRRQNKVKAWKANGRRAPQGFCNGGAPVGVVEEGARGDADADASADEAGPGRCEGKIELEFSRTKRALFRRRRQEAERSSMVVPRGQTLGIATGPHSRLGMALPASGNPSPPTFVHGQPLGMPHGGSSGCGETDEPYTPPHVDNLLTPYPASQSGMPQQQQQQQQQLSSISALREHAPTIGRAGVGRVGGGVDNIWSLQQQQHEIEEAAALRQASQLPTAAAPQQQRERRPRRGRRRHNSRPKIHEVSVKDASAEVSNVFAREASADSRRPARSAVLVSEERGPGSKR